MRFFFQKLAIFVLFFFTPLLQAFGEQIQEISSRTVILLYGLVTVFPIVSAIVIFFITRGILQGLRSTRNLTKKDKLINVGAAIGGFFAILLIVAFQLRTSV